MSTLRYDPSHRRRAVGIGRWRRQEAARSLFLSVVIPARDEAEALPQLVAEIAEALRPLRDGDGDDTDLRPIEGFEIVIVDDGSTDATAEVLLELADDYSELRVIVMAEGVGQSSAIWAGIRAARGGWIATLDADLQNDPADLVHLWRALPGHDVALGWRADRRDSWSRRFLGRWANRVRNAVLGQSIRDTGCSVRVFPRAEALRLPAFRGVHRFLGPLLIREGCRLVQVPVNHRARVHGRSHYHIGNRSIQVILDLLGVAWLMSRPIEGRVLRAWDAGETRRLAPAAALAED